MNNIIQHNYKIKELSNEMHLKTERKPLIYTSLMRRICAMVYDFILLGCVIFFFFLPIPLLDGTLPPILFKALKLSYILLISFGFLGWFWTHGGQTLGMKAWHIKLVFADTHIGSNLTWRVCWLRFTCAIVSWICLGIGFLWSVYHPKRATWHDLFSETAIISTKTPNH